MSKNNESKKNVSTGGFIVAIVVIVLAVVVAIAVLFEDQFYVKVESYEQAVMFTFGTVDETPLSTGLHWRLPYPFQHVEKVNVETERKVQLGFVSAKDGKRDHIESDALILTKSGNLVDLEAEINYYINDVVDYVINIEDQEETVKDAAEATLKRVVGSYSLDDVLTTKKAEMTAEVYKELQELLDFYKLGVKISRVQFIRILNPLKVREAFESVEAAKQDSGIVVEQAEGYRNKVIPEARGQVSKIINAAQAYAIERKNQAEGEISEFDQLLAKYKTSKKVTRKRLYLETMEEILPGIKKVIVDGKGNNVNLMNLGNVGGQK